MKYFKIESDCLFKTEKNHAMMFLSTHLFYYHWTHTTSGNIKTTSFRGGAFWPQNVNLTNLIFQNISALEKKQDYLVAMGTILLSGFGSKNNLLNRRNCEEALWSQRCAHCCPRRVPAKNKGCDRSLNPPPSDDWITFTVSNWGGITDYTCGKDDKGSSLRNSQKGKVESQVTMKDA